MSVVSSEHIKLARGSAVIKVKLRNVRSGAIFEQSMRSGEKYKLARIESGEASYLYADGDLFNFMDSETYETVTLPRTMVADALPFLKEGNPIKLLRYDGQVIGIELPITVELKVIHTEPGVRGDTVSGTTKPATLETGATINVPLFVNEGDVIRVDTRSRSYMERV